MGISHGAKALVKRTQGTIYEKWPRVSPIEDHDLADKNLNPEMNILGKDVLLAIEALPEAQRMTVILVYVDGLSYKEAPKSLKYQ